MPTDTYDIFAFAFPTDIAVAAVALEARSRTWAEGSISRVRN